MTPKERDEIIFNDLMNNEIKSYLASMIVSLLTKEDKEEYLKDMYKRQ